MTGQLPYAVLARLNQMFGPGFILDYDFVDPLWINARDAAELVADELHLQTDEALDREAERRVVIAMQVILWGAQA